MKWAHQVTIDLPNSRSKFYRSPSSIMYPEATHRKYLLCTLDAESQADIFSTGIIQDAILCCERMWSIGSQLRTENSNPQTLAVVAGDSGLPSGHLPIRTVMRVDSQSIHRIAVPTESHPDGCSASYRLLFLHYLKGVPFFCFTPVTLPTIFHKAIQFRTTHVGIESHYSKCLT